MLQITVGLIRCGIVDRYALVDSPEAGEDGMDKGIDSPIVLTPKEAAHVLHVHVNTVKRWESKGILRAHRIGPRRDRRFEQNEILRLINNTGNEKNGK